ncbi:MAG: prephenate dehydrogenase/arogenate dehydrogenase family protein, partial [Wenzhouxiangellaceae bacterium]
LDRIDRELIERAAERQRIVSEIGLLKRSAGRQLRDFQREREVLDGVREHAAGLGLDPDVAESLLTRLIEASLTRQETERVTLSAHGAGKRALVVGGAGRLGRWLVRFLHTQGFEPLVADPCLDEGDDGWRDWREAPLDCELIIVAAPIAATRDILAELIECRPPGIIMDVASIKTPLTETLRAAADAGLKVCSLHPMFGPDTRLLAGQHVLLMDCGNAEALQAARALFDQTMAALVEIELHEHDRLMAWVLGLSHALNVAFAATLAEAGVSAEQLAALSSTTFSRQLSIARDVAAENPQLYFEIQHLNPHEMVVLESLHGILGRMSEAVGCGDEQAFIKLMQQGRDWIVRHRDASA